MHHSEDYYIDLNLPPFWADKHRNEIYVCYLCTLPNANKIVLDMTESLTHLLMVCIKNTLQLPLVQLFFCYSLFFHFSEWHLLWNETSGWDSASCVLSGFHYLCLIFVKCQPSVLISTPATLAIRKTPVARCVNIKQVSLNGFPNTVLQSPSLNY